MARKNGGSRPASQLQQVGDGGPADPGGEQDAVDGPAGPQRLQHRTAALDQDPAGPRPYRRPCGVELAAPAGLLGGSPGAAARPPLLGRCVRPLRRSPAVRGPAATGIVARPAAFLLPGAAAARLAGAGAASSFRPPAARARGTGATGPPGLAGVAAVP